MYKESGIYGEIIMIITVDNIHHVLDREQMQSIEWDEAKHLYPEAEWQEATVNGLGWCNVKIVDGDIVLLESSTGVVFLVNKGE